jgi:hypothetical protein
MVTCVTETSNFGPNRRFDGADTMVAGPFAQLTAGTGRLIRLVPVIRPTDA